MLINISNTLCVSRHGHGQHDKWICYTPGEQGSNKKRQTWKQVTGLMSPCSVRDWLRTHFADEQMEQAFDAITQRNNLPANAAATN